MVRGAARGAMPSMACGHLPGRTALRLRACCDSARSTEKGEICHRCHLRAREIRRSYIFLSPSVHSLRTPVYGDYGDNRPLGEISRSVTGFRRAPEDHQRAKGSGSLVLSIKTRWRNEAEQLLLDEAAEGSCRFVMAACSNRLIAYRKSRPGDTSGTYSRRQINEARIACPK
jgi:hypothetical protein